MKEYEFRSRIFNSIHDSLDVYAFKPEKEVVKALINDCVHWKRYPFEGVEHRMEPEVSDIRDYEHLKEHFYKHGVEEKVMPIEDAVAAYNEKIRNLLYQAENELMPITKKARIKTFDEVEQSYLENFEARKNGKQYKFGDPILDKAVKYGPAPGSGGLIAAATGMGKSAFCLNLINRCINQRVPLMYYSLEMGETDTFDRMMALRSNIDMEDLVNPADQETWQMIKDKIKEQFDILKQNPNFRFSECASISLTQVKQDIKKFQQDIGQEYCIIVFDLLSMVKEFMITDDKGMNFAQGIEVAINILNAMAKELGFHYIAVLQMNRKGEGEGRADDLDDLKKFRPVRNQIKNSGAFLERVRWAIGLFRAKYYAELYIEDEDLWKDMPDYCEVSLLKQNQGVVVP